MLMRNKIGLFKSISKLVLVILKMCFYRGSLNFILVMVWVVRVGFWVVFVVGWLLERSCRIFFFKLFNIVGKI